MEKIVEVNIAYSKKYDDGNDNCGHETFLFRNNIHENNWNNIVRKSVEPKCEGLAAISNKKTNAIFNPDASNWYKCRISKLDKYGDFDYDESFLILIQNNNINDAIDIAKKEIKLEFPNHDVETIKQIYITQIFE